MCAVTDSPRNGRIMNDVATKKETTSPQINSVAAIIQLQCPMYIHRHTRTNTGLQKLYDHPQWKTPQNFNFIGGFVSLGCLCKIVTTYLQSSSGRTVSFQNRDWQLYNSNVIANSIGISGKPKSTIPSIFVSTTILSHVAFMHNLN